MSETARLVPTVIVAGILGGGTGWMTWALSDGTAPKWLGVAGPFVVGVLVVLAFARLRRGGQVKYELFWPHPREWPARWWAAYRPLLDWFILDAARDLRDAYRHGLSPLEARDGR